MNKNNSDNINKDLITEYLKKNKNFFLENPKLIDILNFPVEFKTSNKIIDLNMYRINKIKKDYDKLKNQMKLILKAGSSHIVSQKRILKTSIKILNTKTLTKLINVIVNDIGTLLACDIVNCFFTSEKIKHPNITQIDNKISSTYFRDKPQTYLNQNPKGIPLFFPNKSNLIKSYILLKIVYGADRFIVAMGSKNIKKFTKDQKVDLIEYLIQIIQIKLLFFNHQ